jgi:hypothetical protein
MALAGNSFWFEKYVCILMRKGQILRTGKMQAQRQMRDPSRRFAQGIRMTTLE